MKTKDKEVNKFDPKWAELNSEPELKERKVWFGIYRGIRYEINSFKSYEQKDCWTYYIHLDLDEQFPKKVADKFWLKPRFDERYEMFRRFPFYDPWDSIISKLHWHCGCTYYSKKSKVDDKARLVKIGCDYQHLWDIGRFYSLDYIVIDVKQIIDSLISLVGPPKIRNGYDGKYYHQSEYGEKK